MIRVYNFFFNNSFTNSLNVFLCRLCSRCCCQPRLSCVHSASLCTPLLAKMRPPMAMQSTALQQQNEAFQQAHVHVHATPAIQQQPQAAQHPLSLELDTQQQYQQQQQQQLTVQKSKLPPLELLVEHKLSYSSAATYQQQQSDFKDSKQQQQREQPKDLRHSQAQSSTSCLSAARASIFDDAAENFIINFPAESSLQLLPLSETVPLLTHIEATVVDKQRSIRLNKNSASLIFTKKELSPSSQQLRRQHHSLYGASERHRKQTKHLPSTRGQQQRRSLQLNYNNNLVTTAACNNAGTAGPNYAASGGRLVPHKHHIHSHGQGHGQSHGSGHGHAGVSLTSPTANSAGAAASARKQLSYSWYAPVYSALEEELEQDSRVSSSKSKRCFLIVTLKCSLRKNREKNLNQKMSKWQKYA